MIQDTTNTIIIGAGPAGIAASIQLKRARIPFVLLERGLVGGLLLNANLVENYPGYPGGIKGHDLVERFKGQIDRLGIAVTRDEVASADREEGCFIVRTEKNTLRSKNLIVASGTRPKMLDCPGVPPEKVYYEVYPLRSVKDKNITVIGGGDAAFDYALNLAAHNRVSVFFRGDKPKCLPLLYERAREMKSIQIINFASSPSPFPSLSLDKLGAQQGGEGIRADYIVIAIGREPDIEFLPPSLKNLFLAKAGTAGLYFAGDVARGPKRQVAIATGDGIAAAMDIISGATEIR